MNEALLWLAGGLVLLVAEIVLPGVFLFWLGLAALGTGVVVQLFDPPFAAEVVSYAVFAAISVGVALRLRARPQGPRTLNTAESGLVGRSAIALAFQGREGRVRVGDSDWAARVPSGVAPPAAGDALEVVGVSGMLLIVRPPA